MNGQEAKGKKVVKKVEIFCASAFPHIGFAKLGVCLGVEIRNYIS